MQIIIYCTLGVFFLSTILLTIFYTKLRNKFTKTDQELQKTKQEKKNLNSTIDKIKDELSTKRNGYYVDSIVLLSKEDKEKGKTGDNYSFVIYVKELDRYTNGMSKIQLTNLELTSGFDHNQYDWVKTCVRDKFSSLKKTSDIDWLESEESIKEMRKQKLDKIINLGK